MGAAGAAPDDTGHRPLGGCEAIRPHQRHLHGRHSRCPEPHHISWRAISHNQLADTWDRSLIATTTDEPQLGFGIKR
jgi:hypothetical protein